MKGKEMSALFSWLAIAVAYLLGTIPAMALTLHEIPSRIGTGGTRAMQLQDLENVQELQLEPPGLAVILAVDAGGLALPVLRQQETSMDAIILWQDEVADHLRLPAPYSGTLTLDILPIAPPAQGFTLRWFGAAGMESTILR